MTNPKPTVDLGYPTEPHGRIPSFNSVEDEAEFWDTHDMAEFKDEFEPAELILGPDFGTDLPVKFAPHDRKELDRRAEEMGVEPSTLVRMWIEERLQREAS